MITASVIVTYNPDLKALNDLVSSIYHSVKEVVIVDNGSGNVSDIGQLTAHFANVEILLLNENKGIGYAQNRGIEKVFSDSEVEAVVLFDHDSHPSNDMIEKLVSNYQQLVAQNIPVGAVGSIFIDPRTGNKYPIAVYDGFRLKKILPAKDDMNPVFTSFLIASGCFIPRKTIEFVGMMNESFFIDYIDIEWSFRVYSKGLQLYVCPEATMFHQVGDERLEVLGREISIHSPLRRYYLTRNSVLMTKIGYISWKYKVREMVYTFSRVIIYLFLVKNRLTYLRYIVRGWRDGILGRKGAYIR